jgi:hypothetical protein
VLLVAHALGEGNGSRAGISVRLLRARELRAKLLALVCELADLRGDRSALHVRSHEVVASESTSTLSESLLLPAEMPEVAVHGSDRCTKQLDEAAAPRDRARVEP